MSGSYNDEEIKVIKTAKKRLKNWSKYRVVLLICILSYIAISFILIGNDIVKSIPLRVIISAPIGGVFLGSLIRNWNGSVKDKILASLAE